MYIFSWQYYHTENVLVSSKKIEMDLLNESTCEHSKTWVKWKGQETFGRPFPRDCTDKSVRSCKISIPPSNLPEVREEEDSSSSETPRSRWDQEITSRKWRPRRLGSVLASSKRSHSSTLGYDSGVNCQIAEHPNTHWLAIWCLNVEWVSANLDSNYFRQFRPKPYNFSSLKTNQPTISASTSTLQWTAGVVPQGPKEEKIISLEKSLEKKARQRKEKKNARIAACF